MRWSRHSSRLLKSFTFKLLRTLLHVFAFAKKSTLLFSIDCALFAQNTRGGVPLFAELAARENAAADFALSLLPYLFTSLLPETATPFPQRWGCFEKRRPSSGQKIVWTALRAPRA